MCKSLQVINSKIGAGGPPCSARCTHEHDVIQVVHDSLNTTPTNHLYSKASAGLNGSTVSTYTSPSQDIHMSSLSSGWIGTKW